jgi:hypothetical protein
MVCAARRLCGRDDFAVRAAGGVHAFSGDRFAILSDRRSRGSIDSDTTARIPEAAALSGDHRWSAIADPRTQRL